MAALAAVIFVTGGVTVELAGFGRGEPTPGRLSGGTPIGAGVITAAQAARQHAAAWVVGQVSADAVVACDPAMCAALQAAGVRASRLLTDDRGMPGLGLYRLQRHPSSPQPGQAGVPQLMAGRVLQPGAAAPPRISSSRSATALAY